jgi:histone H3/H4
MDTRVSKPANVARFERFFRVVASLNVDRSDLKRYEEFVNAKVRDLLVRAEATAKANGRDVIQPHDVPITKGLQERIHDYRSIEALLEVEPAVDAITRHPLLDLAYSDETEAQLPILAGGLSVALARSFKVMDAEVKNPRTEDWERAIALFDLLI